LRSFSGSSYVMPTVSSQTSISAEDRNIARDALRNAAQLALVAIQPVGGEPAALASTMIRRRGSSRDQTPASPCIAFSVHAPGILPAGRICADSA